MAAFSMENSTEKAAISILIRSNPSSLSPGRSFFTPQQDDLRPAMLEAYGQSQMITPHFDKLAKESLVSALYLEIKILR